MIWWLVLPYLFLISLYHDFLDKIISIIFPKIRNLPKKGQEWFPLFGHVCLAHFPGVFIFEFGSFGRRYSLQLWGRRFSANFLLYKGLFAHRACLCLGQWRSILSDRGFDFVSYIFLSFQCCSFCFEFSTF